jgi:hypothetical protein
MQFRQKCAAPESLNPPENAFQNPALSVAEGLYGQEYCPFTVRSGIAASTPGETAISFASLDLMICHGCWVRSHGSKYLFFIGPRLLSSSHGRRIEESRETKTEVVNHGWPMLPPQRMAARGRPRRFALRTAVIGGLC